jgi:hypothetical protein
LGRLSKGAENIIAINAAANGGEDIIDAEVVEPHTESQEK